MKGLLFLTLILGTFMSYGQSTEESEHHHTNFDEQSWTLGVGIPYSLEFSTAGINTRLYHNIGEKICFGPEFSYFKSSIVTTVDIDFIAHYIFETKLVGIYPLLGINYTTEKEEGHERESVVGVVYGMGIHRNFKRITCFAEYSRIESLLADQFVTVGLMYTFKKG